MPISFVHINESSHTGIFFHNIFFNLFQKLGVPLEGFVRVQLNIKVDKAAKIHINKINMFPDIIFPVMWLEEVDFQF